MSLKKTLYRCISIVILLSSLACSGGGGSPTPPSPQPPTPPPPYEQLIDNKIPAGPAMIHCLVGRAWEDNCEHLASRVALDSKLKNIAVNVLVGGGFGTDPGRLNHIVSMLSQGGRKVHLLLYITNGASQRGWQNTEVDGLGTKHEPADWRWHVQNNPHVMEDYRNIIRTYAITFHTLKALGGELAISPCLEDNHDDASFNALVHLTVGTYNSLGVGLPLKVVRNSCPGCYPGNTNGIPPGVVREIHTHPPRASSYSNGIDTNDGTEWLMPGQTTQYPRQASLGGISPVLHGALSNNNWFILWSARVQGLGANAPHPDYRYYHRYSPEETEAAKNFLRLTQ